MGPHRPISIVDHWRTAQDWFDTTEQRREAMEHFFMFSNCPENVSYDSQLDDTSSQRLLDQLSATLTVME
jgi:hypothetical protein